MDIAIVTGAETPLGLRVIERLIDQGCRVHGIGNNFSQVTFADPQFVAHAVDLTDIEAVRDATQQILDEEKRLHILIHAIDVTPGTAFRKLPVGNLEAILKIGLLGPVMLTRLALPNLMRFRGQLINIIPSNKSGHETSAINALIEGGLREMNNALFDQARDAGLRVTNLILKQNGDLPPAKASDEQLVQSRIDPEDVAHTVERLLDAHATNVPNEITLYPRLSAEAPFELPEAPEPLDPYSHVILPPKEYFPPEREPIPTKQPDSIERTIPYTDEEMEDKIAAAIEDYEADPERYKAELQGSDQPGEEGQGNKKKRRRRRGGRNRNKHHDEQQTDEPQEDTETSPEASPASAESESNDKPKRRRGGRNRNKKRDDQQSDSDESTAEPTAATSETESSDKPKRRRGGRNRNRKPRNEDADNQAQGDPGNNSEPAEKPRSNRRRSSSDKKPIKTEDAKQAPTKPDTPKPAEPNKLDAEPKARPTKKKAAKKKTAAKKKAKPEQLELVADEKAVKKKAAKKATKKTTVKTAAKKTAAKKKTATKKAVKKKATKRATKANEDNSAE